MQNVNPTTGVRYGYISANSLHPDVLQQLQYGSRAVDVHYENFKTEIYAAMRAGLDDYLSVRAIDAAYDVAIEEADFYDDEPVHEGEYEGVYYRTSWLGGALNVWIFESPVIGTYAKCSPCVPGAGNLDCPTEDGVVCYDVPEDWRDAQS